MALLAAASAAAVVEVDVDVTASYSTGGSVPWPTEHADMQNSGHSSTHFGTGVNGTCRSTLLKAAAGIMFSSSGVTSSNGSVLYVGRYDLVPCVARWCVRLCD
jgi:hypothetical protein